MKSLFLVPMLCVLTLDPASATAITYTDFSSVAGLQLNGDAAQAANVLRLVPSVAAQSGTAYSNSAVSMNSTTAFSTAFEFKVTSDRDSTLGATDGFAFLLQNVGVTALGTGSENLGFGGLNPSVAVVFRGRGPSRIGVAIDGVDPSDTPSKLLPGFYTGAEGAFYDKNEFAWIDYDPLTQLLSVFLSDTSTKPLTALMSSTVDIFGDLGSQAYVGFSAGNGGAFGTQDILNWSFTSTEVQASVPEPASIALMGIALAGLAATRRRKQ